MGKKHRPKTIIPSSQTRPKKKPEIKYVLDQFTDIDLRSWNKIDKSLNEYHIRFFYHLEAQRATKRWELHNALRSSKPVEQIVREWVRIVPFKYTLEPLSSKGSIRSIGGRFNFGRELDCPSYTHFNALYIAGNTKTAYNERFGNHDKTTLGQFDLALQKEDSCGWLILFMK